MVTPPRGTDQARTYLVRVAGAVGVRGWPYTALVRNRRNEAANDVKLAQTDCIAVGQRDLVKVDWVDESGHYLKVHFVNGGITTLTVEESFAYRPGDVLWLWQDDGQALALAAPTAAWPETPWIGVVKLITPNDRVVVDIGSRFVEVDNGVSQLESGYTVRGIDEQVTGRTAAHAAEPRVDLIRSVAVHWACRVREASAASHMTSVSHTVISQIEDKSQMAAWHEAQLVCRVAAEALAIQSRRHTADVLRRCGNNPQEGRGVVSEPGRDLHPAPRMQEV